MQTPEAFERLQQDPVMANIMAEAGHLALRIPDDPFVELLASVAAQQLSGKAARTIFQRFLDLFPDRRVEAGRLLAIPEADLRSVGFSGQKASCLKAIAQYHLEKGISFEKLDPMTDDQAVRYLTQIRGVGRWTAEMLLMFSLLRPDVLPVDDFGIQTAMCNAYQLNQTGKALQLEMTRIAEAWRPYRTLACLYLWRWYDIRKSSGNA